MRSKNLTRIAVALTLGLCVFAQPATIAKNKKVKGEGSKKESKVEKAFAVEGTGLPPKVLKLVNKGDWKSANKELATLAKDETVASRNGAWLAFSYLFLGECNELKSYAERVGAISAAEEKGGPKPEEKSETKPVSKEKGNEVDSKTLVAAKNKEKKPSDDNKNDKGNLTYHQLIVKAFHECCQARFDDAEATLGKMPKEHANDALAYYALSAVAGKQGRAGAAVEYLQRCVALAPNFAWGYRTLGYLQQRWLKEFQDADASLSSALAIEPSQKEVRDMLIDGRLSRNDFDGAVDAAMAGVKSAPKEAHNYYRLSQIYTQQWRLREALDQLAKAISLDPNDPKYYRSKATIRRYQGDLNAAIADQQKAVALGKDKPFELVELASMNLAAGNNNRAADNLKEALKLDPENQLAHEKLVEVLQDERRWDDLVEEFNRALAKRPKDGKLHMQLALVLAETGKKDKAIDEFIEAGNLNQNDPEPHRQLANLYVKNKDFGKASKSYTRALNINPSSVPDFVALGYCYAETDDYMQAEAAFVTAIALQQFTGNTSGPNKLDILRSLSSLLFEEGRYADAAAQFEAVLASTKGTPTEVEDTYLLAQAKTLRDLSQASVDNLVQSFDKMSAEKKDLHREAFIDTIIAAKRYDKALSLIQGFGDLKPQDLWNLLSAKALRQKGDTEGADKLLNRVVLSKELSPSQLADAMVEQAIIQSAKDQSKAEATAKSAIETYNKSFRAYTALGRILLNKGDANQAIEAAKKAQELNPYHAPAYLLLGDAQQKTGAVKDASESYKKAVELYPTLLEAHKSLLQTYKKLAMNAEAVKEEAQIAQMEKIQ